MAVVKAAGHAASAAFVLGVALAGPQALGVAHAESPDANVVAADTGAGSTAPVRARTGRPEGVGASLRGPRAAAAASPSSASPKPPVIGVAPGRRDRMVKRRELEPRATADAAAAREVVVSSAKDVAARVALVQATPDAAPAVISRATYIGDSARVAATLTSRVSGLLVNPITDFLSGALLITRRALTPAPSATAAAPVSAAAAVTGNGTGPVLTGITSAPGSTSVVFTFNGPLKPESATDLANYSITATAWARPQLVTSSGPAAKVLVAQYSDISTTSSQVTLTLARPLRQRIFYRIVISGNPPIVSGDPNSSPLIGGGDPSNPDFGVTFNGDNDETASGDFYGLFAVGRQLSFTNSNRDRVLLAASRDGAINVWRELNGDIDQITALPGTSAITGTVNPVHGSTGTVYVGSVTVPVPSPLTLNGAVDNLSASFVTVPAGGLPAPPPVPTATSPTPVLATSQNLPYTLNITPISGPGTTNLPGIQSGVYAQMAPTSAYPSGLWLVFGGRTNGLHNFSPSGEQSFPPSFQNSSIYVINPVDWQVWSRPWNQTDVPAAVYNSLTSAGQEFYQKGDRLYTMGGYSKPGTVPFTGNVSVLSNAITVTSDVERLAVGQAVSGFLPFPSGQEIFPPDTTITAINGNVITTSRDSEVDAAGASFAASTRDFKTYDTLTALSVSGLVDAVINGGDVLGPATIRQITDNRVAVAGGGIGELDGRTYLAFGHNFQGGYNGATADIAQVYTDEIRSFRIVDNRRSLAIVGYRALRDPVNFRRRDGNLVSFIGRFGRPELAYLGGVFTPGSSGTGYQAPILIGRRGHASVDAAYQQFFNQYTTANIPLYDARTRSMYAILMGGISLYAYEDGQLTENTGLPWVANVTSLVRKPDGSFQEYIMAPIPAVTPQGTGYYGASSAFFANPVLPTYGNGVIPLTRLSGPTVVGYMFGGIYSTVPETSTNTFAVTGASNQVFQVTLTPTGQ